VSFNVKVLVFGTKIFLVKLGLLSDNCWVLLLDYWSLHGLLPFCSFYFVKSCLVYCSYYWNPFKCSSVFFVFFVFSRFWSIFTKVFEFFVFLISLIYFCFGFCFLLVFFVKLMSLVWFMVEPMVSGQPGRVKIESMVKALFG